MELTDLAVRVDQVRGVKIAYVESWIDRISEEVGADIGARWRQIKSAK